MTTHDYPGDTNSPAQVDSTTEPAWQRHADQFAANRDQHGGAHASPAQPDAETSAGEDLDGGPRSRSQSSMDESLFAGTELDELRQGWDSVQAGFVDDPKRCVEQADGLVSSVVEQLSNSFAEARSRLEQQWSRGEDASTEDLRVALKRYREFFDRLLAV